MIDRVQVVKSWSKRLVPPLDHMTVSDDVCLRVVGPGDGQGCCETDRRKCDDAQKRQSARIPHAVTLSDRFLSLPPIGISGRWRRAA